MNDDDFRNTVLACFTARIVKSGEFGFHRDEEAVNAIKDAKTLLAAIEADKLKTPN